METKSLYYLTLNLEWIERSLIALKWFWIFQPDHIQKFPLNLKSHCSSGLNILQMLTKAFFMSIQQSFPLFCLKGPTSLAFQEDQVLTCIPLVVLLKIIHIRPRALETASGAVRPRAHLSVRHPSSFVLRRFDVRHKKNFFLPNQQMLLIRITLGSITP